MDREDPEKRIAELEHRLFEPAHEHVAEPRPLSGPPLSQRAFEATAPRVDWKLLVFLVYGFILGSFGLLLALSAEHVNTKPIFEWLHWLVLGAYGVAGLAFARSRAVRTFFSPKVTIRRVGDEVEVTRGGRTRSFPVASARLGPWATSQFTAGSALHLRNGRHRFVVGGQSHRPPAGTRPDVNSVWSVNAYMPAADFDALLAIVRRTHSH
jgi:hypothetical protein